MFVKYLRFFIREYLFTLLSAVFLALYWNSAHSLPTVAIQYPLIISIVAVIFILWNIYQSIGEFREVSHLDVGEKPFNITYNLTKGKLAVIGASILYVVCIPTIGYVVSTVVFLTGVAYYLGARKPLPLLLFSGGLTAFFYVVFRVAMAVRLPTGILI